MLSMQKAVELFRSNKIKEKLAQASPSSVQRISDPQIDPQIFLGRKNDFIVYLDSDHISQELLTF